MDNNGLVSRRGFLAGSAFAGAGALFGLAGCAPQTADPLANTSPEAGSQDSSDWIGDAPNISDDEIVETIDTEFLVIGAGTGGLFAACAAGDAGMETFVMEKFNGGVVRDDLAGVNSRLQQESGYEIDAIGYLRDMDHYAAGQCTLALHKVWLERSGETIDWYESVLSSYGIALWHEAAEEKHEVNYRHWATGHSPAWPVDGSLDGFTVLTDYAEKTGHVTFRYQTPMVSLTVENDRVTGAIGQGADGYIRVNASKGVLVCTGGYAANLDLLKQLQPHTTSIYAYNSAQPGCEGDGIKACLRVGAKMDETHSSMLFDRASVPADSLGGADCGTAMVFWMGSQPWLKVNLNGERFCNESGTYDFILHADASQPGNIHVCLWDADWQTYAQQFDMHGCSRMFPFDNGAAPNLPIEVVTAMNEEALKAGHIQQADTIEELAEKLGLPAEALAKTVERNNQNYDNQRDDDFGKEPFRLSPVRKPPFFGVRTTGALLCTMDGIVINTQGQALREDGSAIEGLYVTGKDSGGYYSMTYPNLSTGNACGRTVTFARMIAQNLAAPSPSRPKPVLSSRCPLRPKLTGGQDNGSTCIIGRNAAAVRPRFGKEGLGVVEQIIAHDGQRMGEDRRWALGKQGHGRGKAATTPDFQAAQLVHDEEAGSAGGILRLCTFGTPLGMRFGTDGRSRAGVRGDLVEVGVHAVDSSVVDVPGQLRLRRPALFVEGAVGSGQVTPTGERDALAAGQKHVVDAQLLEAVRIGVRPRRGHPLPGSKHAGAGHPESAQLRHQRFQPARLSYLHLAREKKQHLCLRIAQGGHGQRLAEELAGAVLDGEASLVGVGHHAAGQHVHAPAEK